MWNRLFVDLVVIICSKMMAKNKRLEACMWGLAKGKTKANY